MPMRSIFSADAPNTGLGICGLAAAVPAAAMEGLPPAVRIGLAVFGILCAAFAGTLRHDRPAPDHRPPPTSGREARDRHLSGMLVLLTLTLVLLPACAGGWHLVEVELQDERLVIDGDLEDLTVDLTGDLVLCADVRGRTWCESVRMTMVYTHSERQVYPCIAHPWLPGGLSCWPVPRTPATATTEPEPPRSPDI